MWHGLLTFLGIDDVSGRAYAFWSGSGSDLGEIALVGALLAMVRRHNCHVRGCPRIGRHHVEGTTFVVCARHSPAAPPTHEEVIAAHEAAKGEP